MSSEPRVLPGCSVLPPMESPGERPGRREPTETARRAPKGKRAAGRFGVLNAFVDFTMGGLRRNEIAVWLVLWRDTRNGIARTAQADIGRRARIARRTVVRAIQRLREGGLLTVVRQGGINRGPSEYRVRPLGTDRATCATATAP